MHMPLILIILLIKHIVLHLKAKIILKLLLDDEMGPKALFLTTVDIIKSGTDRYHFSFEYRISITVLLFHIVML